MLPHGHLATAVIVTIPITLLFFPDLAILEMVLWVLVAGLVGAFIDMDIVVLVTLKAKKDERLRPYLSFKKISNDFDGFMRTIKRTGVLRTGMVTHFLVSFLLMMIFYFLINDYLIPVAIGAISHLMTDIPHVMKLVKGSKD